MRLALDETSHGGDSMAIKAILSDLACPRKTKLKTSSRDSRLLFLISIQRLRMKFRKARTVRADSALRYRQV
jgi:hypothetical protein